MRGDSVEMLGLLFFIFGRLMEMVDVLDLGSSVERREGSSPLSPTICRCVGMVDNTVLKTVGVIRAGSSPVGGTKNNPTEGGKHHEKARVFGF